MDVGGLDFMFGCCVLYIWLGGGVYEWLVFCFILIFEVI